MSRAIVHPDLSIASVCRTLPTPDDPTSGLFIMRRLAAMAKVAKLRVLQPIPYFPVARPLPAWASSENHKTLGVSVAHAPMFYVPGFLKMLDGRWLYRSVRDRLAFLKSTSNLGLIDAHFAYPDGVGCVRAAREIGVPVFITIRGVEEDYLRIPGIARQIAAALRSANGCICVSHSLSRTAIEAGADPQSVRVIHNAVDRLAFRPGDRMEARSELGIEADARLVVAVGNLLSVKRHDVLISAFASLQTAVPDTRLVIIGGAMHEPGHPRELRQLCDRLRITNRVTFAGSLSQPAVATWLHAADVFALASRREGCCNAVLEALACGLPVVTTAVGDNPWFVKDGENGYIVPVDDSVAMARALDHALERREWNRDHIAAQLGVGDWDRVAAEVLEFFAERIPKTADS